MDFIKEAILLFSVKEKEEFEVFLQRRMQKTDRMDLALFRELYEQYKSKKALKVESKGSATYHALRKRLSHELELYFIMKHQSTEESKEYSLAMIRYFLDLHQYNLAWQLLKKIETAKTTDKNYGLQLQIQEIKLQIMPHLNGHEFEKVKLKILQLQILHSREQQLQLSFIQIQNEFRANLEKGDIYAPENIIEEILKGYSLIDNTEIEASTYLQIIEILRTKYLLNKKFKSFAEVALVYYQKIEQLCLPKVVSQKTLARLEYIMAHAYFRVRNFNQAKIHLQKLFDYLSKNAKLKSVYLAKYYSIKSSIQVFEGNVKEAISTHLVLLDQTTRKLTIVENLNIGLNICGFYCCTNSFSAANKILLQYNLSDSYYQKLMGREWLIRKDLVRMLVQVELDNFQMGISILENLKLKHKEMLNSTQYIMILLYINTILKYLNNPFTTNALDLEKMEEKSNFKVNKLYNDPKLLSFYVWLKAKITKQEFYPLLQEEYKTL